MDFLDQFQFPEPFVAEDLKRQKRVAQPVEDGVSNYMAGHDQGVAFRFFNYSDYKPALSKRKRYEYFEDEDLIEWLIDRKNHPVEKVRFLGPELLEFDEDTKECIGGRYKEAYERYKAGLSAVGLALGKWGVLGSAEVETLKKMRIYTVEQYAATARSKIDGKLPKPFIEAFERAILFVNSKEGRKELDKQAEEILALEKRASAQAREIEALKLQISTKKTPGRPKKLKPRVEEEEPKRSAKIRWGQEEDEDLEETQEAEEA